MIFVGIIVVLVAAYLVATLFAIIYNYRLKKQKFKGIKYSECFSLVKMFSVFIGYLLSVIPLHVIDQYIFRYANNDCRECISKDKCVNNPFPCGCSPRKKAASPFEECGGRYDKIIWSKKKFDDKFKNTDYEIIVNFKPKENNGQKRF